MEDFYIKLEGHEQRIRTLEKEVTAMQEVQKEIRAMNETLVALANELKHTNQHLSRQEEKIREIETEPRNRLQQITAAIIAAIAGGLITSIIATILKT